MEVLDQILPQLFVQCLNLKLEFLFLFSYRLQEQCLKSAWLTVALHEGFKFPKTFKQLTSASNAVNGQVVSWTIGALLYRTRDFPLR